MTTRWPPRSPVRRAAGLRTFEFALHRQGLGPVAGVDEAGRGACAGPLVVAACVLKPTQLVSLADLDDSKRLTERTRELAAEYKKLVLAMLQRREAWQVIDAVNRLTDPAALADTSGYSSWLTNEQKRELLATYAERQVEAPLALAELLHTSDLPERERRWAETIRGAADHLARLTAFVVDAAKVDAAGLALRGESFSPRDLARSVAGLLAVRAEAKGLETASGIDEQMPQRLKGDVVRLRSALENLIDNAVKFTEHGRVTFAVSSARVAKGRTRLNFAVTDSGIGISAVELKRLFQPFAQANPDIARRYGGTGLGLVFVKRIAQAMGGDLKVTSKPGRGSTFRMTVVMENGPPAVQGSAAIVLPSLRVLCVEDNPYGRVVLGTILRELGHILHRRTA